MSFRHKVETAFKSLITAAAPDLPIYLTNNSHDPLNDETTFHLPCVQIECVPGHEEPLGSGNYHFECRILVRGQAHKNGDDDPVDVHEANVDLVFGAVKIDGLAAALSAAVADFYVFDPLTDLGQACMTEHGIFGESLHFRGYGCPSDITA